MKKVAILGPAGSNGHLAASRMLALNEHEIVWCKSNADVMLFVRNNEADVGIVPIWNNTEYFVRSVLDFWLQGENYGERGVYPIAEMSIAISHCLLAKKGVRIHELTEVYSHPQALGQCRRYLGGLTPPLIEKATLTTSGSAKMVAEMEGSSAAAIANDLAADIYGLDIIKSRIEDNNGNETTFHLVSKKPNGHGENNQKTAIVFWVKNSTGGLASPINVISASGRNMSTLLPIPLAQKRRIAFYIEFNGNVEENKKILSLLEDITERLVVIGSFPEIS